MRKIAGTLDTNVILRFLSSDDPRKAKIFIKLLFDASAAKEAYFVPFIVVVELVYTLGLIAADLVDCMVALLDQFFSSRQRFPIDGSSTSLFHSEI